MRSPRVCNLKGSCEVHKEGTRGTCLWVSEEEEEVKQKKPRGAPTEAIARELWELAGPAPS